MEFQSVDSAACIQYTCILVYLYTGIINNKHTEVHFHRLIHSKLSNITNSHVEQQVLTTLGLLNKIYDFHNSRKM